MLHQNGQVNFHKYGNHWFVTSASVLSLWLGCHDEASTPDGEHAASEEVTREVAQAAAALGTETPVGGSHSGSAALNGPSVTEIMGWRAKAPAEDRVLGLAESSAPDFAARVAAMVGADPFTLATAAGTVPVTRGILPEFATALAANAGTAKTLTAVIIPTLPIQLGVEDALARAGVTVVEVRAPNAYVVEADASALLALARNPLTYWLGHIPWDRKIDPLLARELAVPGVAWAAARNDELVEADTAIIAIYDRHDEELIRGALEARGLHVESFDTDIKAFVIRGIDAGAALDVAAIPEVSYLDARRLPMAHMETSMDHCGNHDYVRDTFTYGAGVTIGMIDTGFELSHHAFMGWNPYPGLYTRGWNVAGEGNVWDDPTGHGTHVGGTLLSRWSTVNLDGAAPRSGGDADHRFRVVRTAKNDGSGLYNTDQAMDILASDNGAEIVNNSWGNTSNTGTDFFAVKADATVWNSRQVYVFSAGNTGTAPGSIGSPAAAKNVIGVGNLSNGTLALEYDSSEGPTADGRTKPDLYAPGRWITSANASDLDGSTNRGGTSMAAPHVTGILATLMDHYAVFRRRPAMAKAFLMASAERKSWLPSRTGMIDSYQAHFATSTTQGRWGWRDTDARPYAYTYWDIDIPSGVDEMFVVLTWIEPAPPVGAARATYNDVDLWIDHNRDSGNFGEWSSTGGVDNVEFVRIVNPPSGPYRFKAYNYSVPQDYRPGLGIFYRK